MAKKLGMFETGQDRYAPDLNHISTSRSDYKLDQQRLAIWIGLMAVALPFVLLFGGYMSGCLRESVSHFYFAPFWGDIFTGTMFFIGTFLIAYRGETKSENALSTWAGIGAFGTALFPINGDGCQQTAFPSRVFASVENSEAGQFQPFIGAEMEGYFLLSKASPILHSLFAVMLTAFLAYYCFFVFTRVDDATQRNADGSLTRQKIWRNRLYRASGALIVFAIVAMLSHVVVKALPPKGIGIPGWEDLRASFIAEGVAMFAFGVSWIVKGGLFSGLLGDDSYEV